MQRIRAVAASRPIQIVAAALGGGSALHIVGGTLRDIFLGQTPGDIDLATCLRPRECQERLHGAGVRTVETGLAHGTLTVLADDHQLELTTFRSPGPREGERFSCSIFEDLSGRDFTINAMAYDLEGEMLHDPFGGRADLTSRTVRTAGDPLQRFAEDPLRILRAVRFGPAEDRTIDAATREAAARLAPAIKGVSIERVRDELERIVASVSPGRAFHTLHELGVLALILPELLPALGCEQNEFHVHDVFDHTFSVLEHCPRQGLLRWAALFHDLGKPHTLTVDDEGRRHFYRHEEVSTDIAKEVMRRLRFSNDDIKQVAALVKHHMRPLTCGAPGVRRLMRDLGTYLDDWLRFKIADAPPVMSDEDFQLQYRHFSALLCVEKRRISGPAYGKLAINGDDLKALGIEPGPEMGRILRCLEELVLDDPEQNLRERLLTEAKRHMSSAEYAPRRGC